MMGIPHKPSGATPPKSTEHPNTCGNVKLNENPGDKIIDEDSTDKFTTPTKNP